MLSVNYLCSQILNSSPNIFRRSSKIYRTMSKLAAKVLEEAAKAEALLSSTTVEKPLALELDLGNMLAIDNNQLDSQELCCKE